MFKVVTTAGVTVNDGQHHKDGTIDGLTEEQAQAVADKANQEAVRKELRARYEVRPL